ncbi:MAG: Rieske 2Fe-2S domain-containing protein [Myxococcales bacterium]|nr:MAG: Rieske 2Fe-2S domain-containing protein [Myxococcales bacterium]
MSIEEDKVFVCLLHEIKAGEARSVPLPRKPTHLVPYTAIVLRTKSGELRAYLNECKHLPIPLDAGSGQFWDSTGNRLLCSTHGAQFQAEDGRCVLGPCHGASLECLPLCVEGDKVFVGNFAT